MPRRGPCNACRCDKGAVRHILRSDPERRGSKLLLSSKHHWGTYPDDQPIGPGQRGPAKRRRAWPGRPGPMRLVIIPSAIGTGAVHDLPLCPVRLVVRGAVFWDPALIVLRQLGGGLFFAGVNALLRHDRERNKNLMPRANP